MWSFFAFPFTKVCNLDIYFTSGKNVNTEVQQNNIKTKKKSVKDGGDHHEWCTSSSLMVGSLGWRGMGKRGQPRTLRRILRSDFLLKTRERWVLIQFRHVRPRPFFEPFALSSSWLTGSSESGASRPI